MKTFKGGTCMRISNNLNIRSRFAALVPVGVILGVFIGWLCWIVAANLEGFSFYRLRRLITGETVMSRIVQHPADRWIGVLLLIMLCIVGGLAGYWIFLKVLRRKLFQRGDSLLVSKASSTYPPEWRERVPARVFACLRRGELKVLVHPGVGMLDGGVLINVPMELVPFELRVPNTDVWLRFDESMKVVAVWRREDE